MERLPNIHPGEILREEFLTPLQITEQKVAKDTGLSRTRVREILDGKRAITADTALRLSRYFQTTPQFWLNLQAAFDLEAQETGKRRNAYRRIHAYTPAANTLSK